MATPPRTIVASLPHEATIYQLYNIMAVITHLNPSFHPVPANRVVHIKVDADKVEEAKTLLNPLALNPYLYPYVRVPH